MSIRLKTVLIFISGAVLAAGFLFFYWIPSAERESSANIIKSTHQEMRTLSEMLISPLLKKQYAGIHESIDSVLGVHPYWLSIKVSDENDRRIYPILEPSDVSGDKIRTHIHPIEFRGGTLGSIVLVMDLGPKLAEMRSQNLKLASILVVGFIVILIILIFLLDTSVSRPVRELSTAAYLLKEGDFNAILPKAGNDEIGELIKSFETMRASLAKQKKVLEIAHTELRNSEARFRDFGETASDWYWEMDSKLRFSHFSNRFSKVAAVDPMLLLGKTREETGIPNLDKDAWDRHLSDLHNHRSFRNFIHPRTRENGEVVWLSINGKPIFGADGHFRGFRGTGSDITETVTAREKLRKAMIEAESANAAKSDFLSSMSHELRTPLNGILGFTQLLQIDTATPLTDGQRDSTDQVIKSGNHLLDLIDQVLELAKIESQNLFVSIETINLSSVLNECLGITRVMAEKRGINVKCSDSALSLHVRGDVTRLKQVLLNLLSNAVKYNKEGGNITINMHTVDETMCRIEVSDTGPGIPEEKFEGIFTAFDRLGLENSEVEGTGIGLTITKKLIQLMHGRIGFTSEVGVGSTFWVEIPLADASDQDEIMDFDVFDKSAGFDLAVGTSGDYLLLYVEDNPANVKLMEKIISMVPNLKIITCHTAELGIEVAEEKQPDIIIMDINLPGLSGIEALHKLKDMEKTADIPVIALSAAAMPHEVERGINAGFLAYLTKPIEIAPFMDTLREILKTNSNPARSA